MKRLVKILIALLVLVTSSVCLAQKKYDGKSMSVYVSIAPHHREFVMEMIAPQLKDKWGVELICEEVGAKTMLQKVAVAGKKPSVSVCMWDYPVAMQAVEMGLTAPIDLNKVPNAKELFDYAYFRKDGDLHVLSHSLNAAGIIYNTDI